MSLKAVFFDLDGTLLPMDGQAFGQSYFSRLAKKMAPYGFDPSLLIQGVKAGIHGMQNNDGSRTNEEVFWTVFPSVCGEVIREYYGVLEDFYIKEFQEIQAECGFTPEAAEILRLVKSLGLLSVLATNPVFPSIATESRIRWAGLNPEDFSHITVYENSHFCKPDPAYYRELLTLLNLRPEEVLMVGNDVGDDMVAETLGIKTFLLTRDLINLKNEDIRRWPNGSFEDLAAYLKELVKE